MAGVVTVYFFTEAGGPLADNDPGGLLDQWAENTAKALGDEGVRRLRAWKFSGRGHGHSHGGFQAALHVVQKGPEARIPGPMIKGAVWSPWLEGVSRRNQSTRFKGYHLFRKTAQDLQEAAPEIGQRELDKILPRLGGN